MNRSNNLIRGTFAATRTTSWSTFIHAIQYQSRKCSTQPQPASIYIHYPYCAMICSYCDFNKYLSGPHVHPQKILNAYISELAYFKDLCSTLLGERTIGSIYFGGVLNYIHTHFSIKEECELTLECNPTDAHKLSEFRKIGINRVSVGIQSLDDEELKYLGRKHNSKEALQALEEACKHFPRVSFDMIYARHGKQTSHSWEKELRSALQFSKNTPISHASLYTLVPESATPLGKRLKLGKASLLDPDSEADLYELTHNITQEFGFMQYEVSNFSQGVGNECMHSLSGWQGVDVLAIGPGACSRVTTRENTRMSIRGIRHPTAWMKACESRSSEDSAEAKMLSTHERVQELLLMGLRTTRGITHKTFLQHTGKRFEEVLVWHEVERLVQAGFLFYDEQGLRPSCPAGLQVLDQILCAVY